MQVGVQVGVGVGVEGLTRGGRTRNTRRKGAARNAKKEKEEKEKKKEEEEEEEEEEEGKGTMVRITKTTNVAKRTHSVDRTKHS
jgi:hypothetical protein